MIMTETSIRNPERFVVVDQVTPDGRLECAVKDFQNGSERVVYDTSDFRVGVALAIFRRAQYAAIGIRVFGCN